MPQGNHGSGGSHRSRGRRAKVARKRAGSSAIHLQHDGQAVQSSREPNRVPWTDGSRVLAALPREEYEAIGSALESVPMERSAILYQQEAQVDFVYFPETAVSSLLNRMTGGGVVEVGTIGNEGFVGISVFLGAARSPTETIVQIPGSVRRMSVDDFRTAVAALPTFRALIGRCAHAFMTQVSQTAACNRLHGIEQRCARWLLLTHDRVGAADTFPLTHKFLSFMLGVRRAGVTEALGGLTNAGLIRSGKGTITILDRRELEDASCECYARVRRHLAEPFEPLL
jgi:CRP-like cAMP-binding protein